MTGKFRVLSPSSEWKEGDECHVPLMYISLTSSGKKDGNIIITGSLASEAEIDCRINKLSGDLEMVRKEAKRKLRRLRKKMNLR